MMLFGRKNRKAVAGEPNSAPREASRKRTAGKREGGPVVDVTAVPREDALVPEPARPGTPAVLECRGASFAYDGAADGAQVVRDLSFAVRKGEFVAVVGSNGAGKTTTSKLLNGLLKPSAGEVLVDGVPTVQLRTSELARRVGMLFQNPDRQICQNTVRDELAFSLRVTGVAPDEADRRVDALVDEFGFDADAAPYLLSRGERQMLALASVIAAEPEVLILDEPTCGLDYRECMDVMARVKDLNKRGTTVVMITHDMEVAFDFARRVIAMADGRVVADGAPETVFRNAEAMRAASLVPPQMIELSIRLAQEPENGRAFAHVATAYEMVQVLGAAGFRKRKVS